jgi:hypothetical protein
VDELHRRCRVCVEEYLYSAACGRGTVQYPRDHVTCHLLVTDLDLEDIARYMQLKQETHIQEADSRRNENATASF